MKILIALAPRRPARLPAASSASAQVKSRVPGRPGHAAGAERAGRVRSSPNGHDEAARRIVNGERVAGPAVTLELQDVSERQALDVLLRGVSGYIVAPRETA